MKWIGNTDPKTTSGIGCFGKRAISLDNFEDYLYLRELIDGAYNDGYAAGIKRAAKTLNKLVEEV